ncbi:MAG: hypothetical protein EBR82_37840 [Caulobacteraceae bacterium]|nr:hypothetical protein [Caulobacteraceae bacterium]
MARKAAGARRKRAAKDGASREVGFASDGPRVTAWLEAYVRHTKGPFAGEPLVLEDWQVEFVNELYRLDEDGRRVYSNALLLLPRKNGKSTLASGLGLYELCGDSEMSPEIYLAANSREQASAVFRQMRDCVLTSPSLADWVKPMRSHLECDSNMGIARVVSAQHRTVHGTNPSFACQDELWGAKSSDLLEALVSGQGARTEPLTCIISTVGYDRLQSPLGLMHQKLYELPEDAREERNDGFLQIGRNLEAGFLYWCYGPPMTSDGRYDCDLTDPKVWAKCNPASWITEDFLQKQFHSPSMRPAEFERFFLNAWSTSEDHWLPQGSWDECRHGFEAIKDGAKVTVGIDLGQRRDRSAVVVCRRREVDGELHFDVQARVWEPPEAEGVNFDINEIRMYIRELASRFDVERIAFDPWRLEETGQALEDDGLPMVRFDMGWSRTGPASEGLYEAIVSGRLHHDGDPVLAAHVSAGATTENERGWRLTKRKATEPIDALMALLMAHAESMAALGHGAQSVYEQRDLVVL